MTLRTYFDNQNLKPTLKGVTTFKTLLQLYKIHSIQTLRENSLWFLSTLHRRSLIDSKVTVKDDWYLILTINDGTV